MPDDPSTIDDLMDLDPLELTQTNIWDIVNYHRRNRLLVEAGAKPKKEKGPTQAIDLKALGLVSAEPKQLPFKRR